MTIKGIIFDKDGTLFDFQQSWGESTYDFLLKLSENDDQKFHDLAKALKFDLNLKIFKKDSSFIAGTVAQTIQLLLPLLPGKSAEEIWAKHLDHYSQAVQFPVKNLHKTLLSLKSSKYSLGVATNDLEKPTLYQLNKTNIFQHFDCVVCADSGFGTKPDPTQLVQVSRSLNLNFSELIMVGDSVEDLIAAKRTSIQSIGVLTGVASKTDLSNHANIVLNDISELVPWLKAYNN